ERAADGKQQHKGLSTSLAQEAGQRRRDSKRSEDEHGGHGTRQNDKGDRKGRAHPGKESETVPAFRCDREDYGCQEHRLSKRVLVREYTLPSHFVGCQAVLR